MKLKIKYYFLDVFSTRCYYLVINNVTCLDIKIRQSFVGRENEVSKEFINSLVSIDSISHPKIDSLQFKNTKEALKAIKRYFENI